MPTLITVRGDTPVVHPTAWVAPNATLIGRVKVGERASVWFGAVLRADQGHIVEVGALTSVQDNSVIHTTGHEGTVIGERATIGHNAVLEGCVVEDGALVGMLACILPGAVVGEGALVAAGAVVRENDTIPARTLAAGVPAVVKGSLEGEALAHASGAANDYQRLMDLYGEDG